MSSRSNQRGFTLLEVLLAISIFSIGIVFVIEGLGRSQQIFGISHDWVNALQLAEQKVVESQMEVLEKHSLRPGRDGGSETIVGRDFRWKENVQPYADETMKDQTKMSWVEVAMEWKSASRQDSLELNRLLLKREKKI